MSVLYFFLQLSVHFLITPSKPSVLCPASKELSAISEIQVEYLKSGCQNFKKLLIFIRDHDINIDTAEYNLLPSTREWMFQNVSFTSTFHPSMWYCSDGNDLRAIAVFSHITYSSARGGSGEGGEVIMFAIY